MPSNTSHTRSVAGWRIPFVAPLLLCALAACVPAPAVRSELPAAAVPSAEAAQRARESRLRAVAGWSLSGRIAVSNARDGGSGRIDWRQDGPRFEVSLAAPVTRQSWRLAGDAAGARLEGLADGPRSGPDAAALLRDATGWDIPVVALADWVRGLRAPSLPAAVMRYGTDGLPARIEQGGWSITYEWPAAAGADALPVRLDARRADARVKLVVDQWGGND